MFKNIEISICSKNEKSIEKMEREHRLSDLSRVPVSNHAMSNLPFQPFNHSWIYWTDFIALEEKN